MAKTRFIGKGALVKVASGNTYVAVGLCTTITPPPQEKNTIDCTALEDTTAVSEQGIEQLSEFSFEHLHDPDDATDDQIDGLYASGNSITWQIITAAGGKTLTKSFAGRVFAIIPGPLDKGTAQVRTVKVVRNGAITDTVV